MQKVTKNIDELKTIYKETYEKVLVACPTYIGKKYALEGYVRAYNDFVYPYRSLFMVDNTGSGLKYFKHLKKLGVPCVHINPSVDFVETFTRSWMEIWKEAKKQNVQWVMSIEQDNICPPLTIDTMLNVAGYLRALHVAHAYPWHKTQSEHGYLTGLGCNLIHIDLLNAIFTREKWYTAVFESELFETPKILNVPSTELYNLLDIQHLDDHDGCEVWNFAQEKIPVPSECDEEMKQPTKYLKPIEAQ